MNAARRKILSDVHEKLSSAIADVAAVLEAEETARDNVPEAFCDKADAMQEAIDSLEEIRDSLQDGADNLQTFLS